MVAKSSYHDSPSVWFTVLETALRAQDFAKAAQAKAELERLGVEVRFHQPLLGVGK